MNLSHKSLGKVSSEGLHDYTAGRPSFLYIPLYNNIGELLMTEWGLLSKMQELANKKASVPPAMASILNSLNSFTSMIDSTICSTCYSASSNCDSSPVYGCNNPYGDGSDPEYICSWFSEGNCTGGEVCKNCKERFCLKEVD